jgi:alkanesulfonate monooxygenase SsuD/methylene tetrahydromethanopterin reductase-like flavin-dependent oxidoreductase (luciferase family)
MAGNGTRFGILLPHFGAHASWPLIFEAAGEAEAYGFDSVWVRDHIVFRPHDLEGTDRSFFEPFSVLHAVAAKTERIRLGTGSLIPYRHPIHAALSIAALSGLAGDRLIIGFGAGNFDFEFEALGINHAKRPELVREQIPLLRRLLTGDAVSHEGTYYRFEDVQVLPRAVSPIPFWYCGGTPASTRHAAEYCDGWMPGRITVDTYRARVDALRDLCAAAGRSMPALAAIPMVSPGRNVDEALDGLSVELLLANANKQRFWVRPPHGSFETPADLRGSFLYGTPDDIVEGAVGFLQVGIDELVLDLRLRFGDFRECLATLGEEVLPRLRQAAAP